MTSDARTYTGQEEWDMRESELADHKTGRRDPEESSGTSKRCAQKAPDHTQHDVTHKKPSADRLRTKTRGVGGEGKEEEEQRAGKHSATTNQIEAKGNNENEAINQF